MSRVVACLMLACGCIDIHPYDNRAQPDAAMPNDGGPPNDGGGPIDGSAMCHTSVGASLGNAIGMVTIAADGAGALVTSPWYTLHFATGAVHFPDAFTINGVQMLATAPACGDPTLMGVQIYPGARSDTGTASLAIVRSGPYLPQIVIQWSPGLGCGTSMVSSKWTFFPDGRITRDDKLSAAGQSTTGCTTCGSGAAGFQVLTETLFDQAQITSIVDDQMTLYTAMPSVQQVSDGLCIASSTASAKLLSIDVPGPIPLLRQVVGNTAISYQFYADTTLQLAEGSSSVIVAPDTQTCQALLAATAGFEHYVDLRVDGVATDATNNKDGVFGLFDNAHGEDVNDFATLTVPTGSPAPAGFTIGLHYQAARTSFVVKRNGVQLGTSEALVEPYDATHVALWLRDSFGGDAAACDAITVEASP